MAKATSGGGRPKGYFTTDGKRVPGVTTILSRFKDSGGLIYWAWDLGMQGKDYREVRDEAGGAGHVGHDMIECDLTGRTFDAASVLDDTSITVEQRKDRLAKAHKAFDAYREWRSQNNLEIVACEVPLVSDVHLFGGTIDAIARVNGRLVVLDWKTSNRIYPEYIVQVSAYRELWAEHHGERAESVQLLRIGKEFADFHHHSWPGEVLDVAWEMFRAFRRCYHLDATLKRAVG